MARRMHRGKINYRGKTPGEILDIYPEAFRDCRIGHDWSRRAIYELISPTVRERTEICRRCASTRSFLINSDGHRIESKARRHYEAGYLTPRTGLTRWDFAARVYSADFERALAEGRVRQRGEAGNVTELHSTG